MKGRKKVPSRIKELRGTDQPVRMNTDEVVYESITKVTVPKILKSKRARQIYKERAQVLINQKLLQQPDMDLLVAYANTYDMYLEAVESQQDQDLIKTVIGPTGGTKNVVSVYIQLQLTLLEMVNKIGAHFGFTPSSRASLKIQAPKETISEFEKLMRGQ